MRLNYPKTFPHAQPVETLSPMKPFPGATKDGGRWTVSQQMPNATVPVKPTHPPTTPQKSPSVTVKACRGTEA